MLDKRSKFLRQLVVEMVEVGRRGHIGSAMSLIEILRVLYDYFLRYRPNHPHWPDRDRFILSKGHGCLALYAVLADKGFLPLQALSTFCRSDSRLGGHPEIKVPGVEASTGSLGHGFSIGVGMALAAKIRRRSYRVAVVVGDGEINEGSIWEAAMSAAKHELSNLVVVVDYNKLQSYGLTTEVMNLEPLLEKWNSFGFCAREIDGHNVDELEKLVKLLPFHQSRPSAVICHTIKGKGFPMAENKPEWHHKSQLTDADIATLYSVLEEK